MGKLHKHVLVYRCGEAWRILTSTDEAWAKQIAKENPNYILNPDLALVAGLASHYWEFEDDTFFPMSRTKRRAVDKRIKDGVFISNHKSGKIDPPRYTEEKRSPLHDWSAPLLIGLILGIILTLGFTWGIPGSAWLELL